MEDGVKKFGLELDKLVSAVENLNPGGDLYEVESKIKDLDKYIDNMKKEFDDLETELNDSSSTSNTKPLINKLSSYKSDLEICENKLNKKREQWKTQERLHKFQKGELTGTERYKTERDMLVGQHKETDEQGEIIDNIASNIKSANANLTSINSELTEQGQQIERVQKKTLDSEVEVKQTDRIMTNMQKRQRCMKVIGGIAVIVFGIFDLFWLIYWLIRTFGNKEKTQ